MSKIGGSAQAGQSASGSLSQRESALKALGIVVPPPKVRVSDVMNRADFVLADVYTDQDYEAHQEAINKLLDLAEIHGHEHVRAALIEIGEAGSSSAWRVLSAIARQQSDDDATKDFALRARFCALSDWDEFVSILMEATPLSRQITDRSADEVWLQQSPHPLTSDIQRISSDLRATIEGVYPDSEQLNNWLREDESGTASMLAEAGFALQNIHRFFGLNGLQPPHAGGMALGLALISDFADPESRESAEKALRNLVTVQGQLQPFAEEILEISALKPKLEKMGLWRWSTAEEDSDLELFRGFGLDAHRTGGKIVINAEKFGLVFLSWFDSPLGIELLDVRAPIIQNIPTKSPQLLTLIESYRPELIGQWIFAGDEDQGYNLTFGFQIPREFVTRDVVHKGLAFLGDIQEVGFKILQDIANTPKDFPGYEGTSIWTRGPEDPGPAR